MPKGTLFGMRCHCPTIPLTVRNLPGTWAWRSPAAGGVRILATLRGRRRVLTRYPRHCNAARIVPLASPRRLALAPVAEFSLAEDLPEADPRRAHPRIPDNRVTAALCDSKQQITAALVYPGQG